MLAALFAIFPFISTTLGGLVVLRMRHRLHPVMGFAAGVVVATALADLIPEARELVGESHVLLIGGASVTGYLGFSALEALLHRQSWEHQHEPQLDPAEPHVHARSVNEHPSALSLVGSAGLIIHSTLDGLAIGLGFQASNQVGLIVALAVLAHDFADGMNVVTLALAGGQGVRSAEAVLALDAIAPVVGVAIGTVLTVSDTVLGTLLAGFAGVFIAVGAGHLLPEAQHQRPGAAPAVVLLAALGAVFVLLVRRLAG